MVRNDRNDAARAAELRRRARGLRDQSAQAARRTEAMAPGLQRDMLAAQARMLGEGADDLEAQALVLIPALGSA